jgi:uncharacterized membrane-anchored protein
MSEYLSDAMRHPKTILNKVPEITACFWITKVLISGMGEVTSDYLSYQLNPIIAVTFAGICLAVSLVLQFSVRRYVAWIYWLNVVMVSVFGTMAADFLHIGFGIPYLVSTMFFVAALAIIFAAWYVSEKTLSINSICTRRREAFYWAAILATFALGTAAGDMTATTMHLGYHMSISSNLNAIQRDMTAATMRFGYVFSRVLFAVSIAIPVVACWMFGRNKIFIFWFAYIVTRPLGASFADWMGVSHIRGGLGLGTGPVSLGLMVFIIGLIGYMAVTHRNVKEVNNPED